MFLSDIFVEPVETQALGMKPNHLFKKNIPSGDGVKYLPYMFAVHNSETECTQTKFLSNPFKSKRTE